MESFITINYFIDFSHLIMSRRELIRTAKEIQIPIHGSISVTYMAKYFIDNRFFQRLKNLKQLGVCDYIFPGATHTRFEHSLGTYHLADRIMHRIKNITDNTKMVEWLSLIPEIKDYVIINNGLDDWIIELVKIAALCHDIGHGPFSHLFDDIFIKKSNLSNHPMATHEFRSCAIVEAIVRETHILSQFITDNDLKFIQTLINPTSEHIGFIYQIVSNNLNGLDVDKYDYISRDSHHIGIKNGFDHSKLVDSVLVIDNNIVYQEQAEPDIYNLYVTRYFLHRKVYGHKGVISTQYIVLGIMEIIDKVVNISNSIIDLNHFITMTDEFIIQTMKFIIGMKNNLLFTDKLTHMDYFNLDELHQRIQTHRLYPHIGTIITKNPCNIGDCFEKSPFHFVHKYKVGYVSGNKSNPLDMIYVYKTKDIANDKNVAYLINKNEISCIMPDIYQEYVIMVFRKDHDPDAINSDKEIFKKNVESFNK